MLQKPSTLKLVAQRKELYAKYNVRMDGRIVVNLGDSRHTCGRRCSDEETVQKEMIVRSNKKKGMSCCILPSMIIDVLSSISMIAM